MKKPNKTLNVSFRKNENLITIKHITSTFVEIKVIL